MYFPCTMQGFNEWHKELFISFGWMQLVKHHSVYSDMILEKEAYAKRIDAYEDSMKLFLAKISEKIDTNPNNMNIEELNILRNDVKILYTSFIKCMTDEYNPLHLARLAELSIYIKK